MTNNIQYTEQNQNIDLHSNTDTSKSTSTEDSFNRVIQHSRLYFFETEAKIDKVIRVRTFQTTSIIQKT